MISFNKKELNDSEKEKDLTQGDENQLSKNKINSKGNKKLVGKRIDRKFISKNKKVIHADVNGSFNIVRKVLLNFNYKEEIINIEYELMEISNYQKRKLFNFHDLEIKIKNQINKVNQIKELT